MYSDPAEYMSTARGGGPDPADVMAPLWEHEPVRELNSTPW